MRIRRVIILALIFAFTVPLFTPDSSRAQESQNYSVITADNADQLQEIARFGRGTIHDMEWSPNNDWIAVAGSLGVWLIDPYDLLAEPILLEGHTDVVSMVSFHPDGELLASVSDDGTVKIWDLTTLEIIKEYENANGRALDISPDGQYIAYSAEPEDEYWQDYARIINFESDEEFVQLDDFRGTITTLEFSADSAFLHIADAAVSDAPSWGTTTYHLATMEYLQIQSVDRLKMSSPAIDYDYWSERTYELDLVYPRSRWIVTSPDHQWLAMQTINESEYQWEVNNITIMNNLTGHIHTILNMTAGKMAFSADGTILLVMSSDKLFFWNVDTGSLIHTYSQFTSEVERLERFDGRWLAVQRFNKIELYDMTPPTPTLFRSFTGNAFDFAPASDMFIVVNKSQVKWFKLSILANESGSATLMRDGEAIEPIEIFYEGGSDQFLVRDEIGEAYNGTLRQTWSRYSFRDEDGNELDQPRLVEAGTARQILFSNDDEVMGKQNHDDLPYIRQRDPYLLFDLSNTSVLLYNTNTEQEQSVSLVNTVGTAGKPSHAQYQINGQSNAFAVSRFGGWLALADSSPQMGQWTYVAYKLTVYRATGGSVEPITLFDWYEEHENVNTTDDEEPLTIYEMQFSPDNGILAVAEGQDWYYSERERIRIWEYERGELVTEIIAGHTRPVTTIDFSLDGRFLYTGSDDGTVRIWGVVRN